MALFRRDDGRRKRGRTGLRLISTGVGEGGGKRSLSQKKKEWAGKTSG